MSELRFERPGGFMFPLMASCHGDEDNLPGIVDNTRKVVVTANNHHRHDMMVCLAHAANSYPKLVAALRAAKLEHTNECDKASACTCTEETCVCNPPCIFRCGAREHNKRIYAVLRECGAI